MKKVVLYIDTSSNQEVIVALTIDEVKDEIKQPLDKNKAQVVLPIIDRLLEKHQLQPSDITGINVNNGPGSFTGLRVGVSIANAMAFALGISVNDHPVGIFVEPEY